MVRAVGSPTALTSSQVRQRKVRRTSLGLPLRPENLSHVTRKTRANHERSSAWDAESREADWFEHIGRQKKHGGGVWPVPEDASPPLALPVLQTSLDATP